jgi:hypothetical protein
MTSPPTASRAARSGLSSSFMIDCTAGSALRLSTEVSVASPRVRSRCHVAPLTRFISEYQIRYDDRYLFSETTTRLNPSLTGR